jgi:hypothetical protein
VLVQNFLDSLGKTLQSDGTSAAAEPASDAATGATAAASNATADDTSSLALALKSLLSQLQQSAGSTSAPADLITSFGNLLQGSGIDPAMSSSDQANAGSSGSVSSALQTFLQNTLSGLSGAMALGKSVNASA